MFGYFHVFLVVYYCIIIVFFFALKVRLNDMDLTMWVKEKCKFLTHRYSNSIIPLEFTNNMRTLNNIPI